MSTSNVSHQSWFDQRIERWAQKKFPPRHTVLLNRKNILIFPTSTGFIFAVTALVVFIAAVNYENSLAYGLAFFMISIFIVTLLYSFNNLNRIRLTALPNSPVFCGEDACFQVALKSNGKRFHESLEMGFSNGTVTRLNLDAEQQLNCKVYVPANRRGEFKAPRLQLSSIFPLGLFKTWSNLDLSMSCLVYPAPVAVRMEAFYSISRGEFETSRVVPGQDDFYGLRTFNSGDSLKHVAWKNVARGQGMLVKQFVDYADDRVWLCWDNLKGLDIEERLSRLCHGVLKLSADNVCYGLRLPGQEVPQGAGKGHRLLALEALARYEVPLEDRGQLAPEGN